MPSKTGISGNPGIDLQGIARAVWYNVTQQDTDERPMGGSTITQQLVRTLIAACHRRNVTRSGPCSTNCT